MARGWSRRVGAESPGSGVFAGRFRTESPGQLGTRADTELAVDPLERALDRLDAEEERGGRLLVAPAFSDEVGDPPLGLGERAAGRSTSADARELPPRVLRPDRCRQRLEDRQRLLDRRP